MYDQSDLSRSKGNGIEKLKTIVENRLAESAYFSCNFDKIPPIIGFLIADQYGNTLMVIEYKDCDNKNYKPIKAYLSEADKNLLEIDLISMYFSSIKTFAGQTNIQNLSNLEIHGSNIKVQIFYLFEKYMIIAFLNSHTELSLGAKSQIIRNFEDLIDKNKFEFKHFNASKSRNIISLLENKKRVWLKKLNKDYLRTYKDTYLKKHEFISEITQEIKPIINNVLFEYLANIQEDLVNSICKEIINKVQDILFNFDSKEI
jgi:hypothetical protein